jgi:hypothetical protein
VLHVIGHPIDDRMSELASQNRTTRTWQPGQNRQGRTVRTEQSWQDKRDRTAGKGEHG